MTEPHDSKYLDIFGPQFVELLGRVREPLGSAALREEAHH